MGHRLTAILSALNAVGLFACLLLIALASSKDPLLGVQITQAIRHSLRMYVLGAALPALAIGIAALELDRSNARIRLLESWATSFLLLVSLVLFVVAGWRLPHSLMSGFQGLQ
jgi:hypothetical protein